MIGKMDFGGTGHSSTRVIFGAAALGSVTQAIADTTLEALLKHGVNHLDVAASYGRGEAEKRMAPWMATQRKSFFLATKTNLRTYSEAKSQFRESLERLGVDSVDLIQMHNLTNPEDWETAMGPDGALEALIEAKQQGLTRFIGVTGHGLTAPKMHLKSLERYAFDSVLLPYNYVLMQVPEYAADFESLVETCKRKKVAVQTIKSLARRPWTGDRKRTTWYEPLEEQEDIDLAARWVLGNPDVFLISSGDVNILPRILEAAEGSHPRPSDAEMSALIDKAGMEMIFEGSETITPRK